MATRRNKPIDVFGATLTRRQFVKTSGMLAVGISVVGTAPLRGDTPKATIAKNSLDPALPSSWIEIHADNTVLIRTGKNDFGQGTVFTRLSADSGRRTEHALRGHHHRRFGRLPTALPTAVAPSIFWAGVHPTCARWLRIPTRRCSILRQRNLESRKKIYP